MGPLKVFMVAGDISGDRHGGSLVREMRKLRPDIEVAGLGGPALAEAGCQVMHDMMPLAVMGLRDALKILHEVKRLMRKALVFLRRWRPDVVVLIDYPGFNIHFAKFLKEEGRRTVYYIPPQLWAWAPGRIRKIRERFDKVLVILPFEEPLYRQAGIETEYVGHPAFDYLSKVKLRPAFRTELVVKENELLLGMLPGSRVQEIEKSLPMLYGTVARIRRELPAVRFVLTLKDALQVANAKTFVAASGLPIVVVQDATFDVMAASDLCLVVSGTATLELAYFLTPMVIVYRVHPLSPLLARLILKTDHIGLVNVIANRRIAPELLVGTDSGKTVAREAITLLKDEDLRAAQVANLRQLKAKVAYPGASRRAAEAVLRVVESA